MTKRWLSLLMVLALLVTMFTGATAESVKIKGLAPVITFEPRSSTITATSASQQYTAYELGTFKSDGALLTTVADNVALATALGAITNVNSYVIQNSKLYGTFTGPAAANDPAKNLQFRTLATTASYDFSMITGKVITSVQYPVAVTSITLSQTALEFAGKGGEQTLTATIKPAGLSVTLKWESDNPDVATVDSTGKVVAIDKGTAKIKATAPNGVSATATVTVNHVKATSIAITRVDNAASEPYAITKGNTIPLTAENALPSNATSTTYTWKSGNTATATVDDKGVVTGVDTGTAVITVTNEDGVSATATVTVGPATSAIEDVWFSLEDGATFSTAKQLELFCNTADVDIYYILNPLTPPTAAEITKTSGTLYSPSNPISLPANRENKVYAKAFKGNAVSAMAIGTFKVDIKLISVNFSAANVTIAGVDKSVIDVLLNPANANVDLSFAWSGDTGIIEQADCSYASGKYTIVNNGTPGNATLTVTATPKATAYPTLTAECKVVVNENPVTSVIPSPASITLEVGQQVLLKGIVSPTTATDKRIKYEIAVANSKIDLLAAGDGTLATVGNIKSLTGATKGAYIVGTTVGTDTVYLTGANGVRVSCPVTVIASSKKVATPVITATNGSFTKTTDTVTITCPTTDKAGGPIVKIYYTTDGSKPTTSSTEYTVPFPITSNATTVVRAIAVDTAPTAGAYTQMTASDIAAVSFTSALAVKGLTIAPTSATIKGLGKTTLTATFKINDPATNATAEPNVPANKAIAWTSSNPAVATVIADEATVDDVNPTATVKALSTGSTTITATSVDGAFKATSTITVTKLVPEHLTVEYPPQAGFPGWPHDFVPVKDSLQMGVKFWDDAQHTNEVFPTDPSVTWTSSNSAVATIDANGLVTGVSKGQVIITAKSKVDATVMGTAIVDVVDEKFNVDELYMTTWSAADPAQSAQVVSGKYTEEILVYLDCDTYGATIYYTTDGSTPNTSSTKYDPTKGLILNSKCTLRVMATKDTLIPRNQSWTYDFAIPVTGVALDKAYQTIAKGGTLQLTATIKPSVATNKAVSWTSSRPDIATVSNGLVTAVAEGEATITVTTNDGSHTASCIIKVDPAVATSVTVTPSTLSMSVNEVKGLVVSVLPAAAAGNATWSSSNYAVASVDSNGVVTALKAGSVTITATVGSMSGTCAVTVADDSGATQVEPLILPTFTPTETEFKAVQNTALTKEIGKFVPGTGETWAQIAYYYDVQFTITGLTNAAINVGSDGTATLYIGDVGAENKTFSYQWKLVWKSSKGSVPGILNGSGRTITGNQLNIITKPTTIAFVDAKVGPVDGSTTKTVVVATLSNYADFVATGVSVTATVAGLPGATATIGADGKVTLNIPASAAKGEYDVIVTISAPGCEDVKTEVIKVTITEEPIPPQKKIQIDTPLGAYDNGKAAASKHRQIVARADSGLAKFSVPGYTVTSWKTNKKAVKIDANGVATFTKGVTNVLVTATLSDGTTVKDRINVVNMASALKLQWKKGSKWVDFTKETPVISLSAKSQKLTVRVTPTTGSKMFGYNWTMDGSGIASNSGAKTRKQVITGKAVGDATVTITLFNKLTTVSGTIRVVQSKGIEDEYEEILDTDEIEELEEEEFEEEELDEEEFEEELDEEELDEIDEIDEVA